MKHTKVMLAFLGSFMLTWVLLTLLCTYLFESEFKYTMQGCFVFMIILGWIPALVVSKDLSDKLDSI